MIVCSCNVLSDYEIRNVVAAAREQPLNANLNANEVYRRLGCSMRCGRCAPAVKRITEGSISCPEGILWLDA
jgi:bacterioferritin-associated ferredoxin